VRRLRQLGLAVGVLLDRCWPLDTSQGGSQSAARLRQLPPGSLFIGDRGQFPARRSTGARRTCGLVGCGTAYGSAAATARAER